MRVCERGGERKRERERLYVCIRQRDYLCFTTNPLFKFEIFQHLIYMYTQTLTHVHTQSRVYTQIPAYTQL